MLRISYMLVVAKGSVIITVIPPVLENFSWEMGEGLFV